MIYYLTATGNGNSPDGTLPAGAVVCTLAQYQNAGLWTVSGGAIVDVAPPTPTLAEQQALVLAPSGAGAGIVITCTSVPALSGTYAIDPVSQAKTVAVGGAINAGLGLPGGGSTFNYPDITGTLHAWTAATFPELAKAAMNLVYAMDMVVAANTGPMPTAAQTIA